MWQANGMFPSVDAAAMHDPDWLNVYDAKERKPSAREPSPGKNQALAWRIATAWSYIKAPRGGLARAAEARESAREW